MTPEPLPLPIAPADCTLDHDELSAQLDRYRQLSTTVASIERHPGRARVLFTDAVDRRLLDDTMRIERGCCSFFALHYDPSGRALSIGVEPEHDDTLSLLVNALAPRA
jgi:hypothetical protein